MVAMSEAEISDPGKAYEYLDFGHLDRGKEETGNSNSTSGENVETISFYNMLLILGKTPF
jgi:hypothetical protein